VYGGLTRSKRGDIQMRMTAAILVGTLGMATAAMSANAAPVVPSPANETNVVQVAGGCGPGFHPNRWGRCVPNRYSYYGHHYWGGPYRGWRSPSDNVARDLNRRELGRNYYGSSRPY
jgi:hypothetical protein